MLATASAKKNESEIFAMYNTAGGRGRVENVIVGKARQEIREEFLGCLTLLKYWRDQAAHGGVSRITDNEAFTSLVLLLRFALFVEDNWGSLTESSTP